MLISGSQNGRWWSQSLFFIFTWPYLFATSAFNATFEKKTNENLKCVLAFLTVLVVSLIMFVISGILWRSTRIAPFNRVETMPLVFCVLAPTAQLSLLTLRSAAWETWSLTVPRNWFPSRSRSWTFCEIISKSDTGFWKLKLAKVCYVQTLIISFESVIGFEAVNDFGLTSIIGYSRVNSRSTCLLVVCVCWC